jgi:hypothetical protein
MGTEFNQKRTEDIIHMTFTKKRPTMNLHNAKSRDACICKGDVQGGIPKAEARSN